MRIQPPDLPELARYSAERRIEIWKDARRRTGLGWQIAVILLAAALVVALILPVFLIVVSLVNAFDLKEPFLFIGIILINAYGLLSLWIVVSVLDRLMTKRWLAGYIPHLCSSCGYDLTANTSGVCPECGRGIGRRSRPEGEESDAHPADRGGR